VQLRKRYHPGGGFSWQLDYGKVDGKRKMVSFGEDKQKAERALAKAQAAVVSHGQLGLSASPMEMAEFLTLKERLRAAGATITEAVEFYVKHGTLVKSPVLVPELVQSFIWSREEAGRSQRTLETYRCTLKSLGRALPLTMAHHVSRADLEVWLNGQGWEPRTINGALGHVRSLFAWARRMGHVGMDPSEGIEHKSQVNEEIEALSLSECARLLKRAMQEPRMMPYVALGLFTGMRRAELERLRWEQVEWSEQTVIVQAKKVKTRQRRVVDVPDVAVAWIEAAGWTKEKRVAKGRVAPSNLKEMWPVFWKAAGFERWPNNGLRHTFASMHYAAYQDEAKLQAMMGHRSAAMLHQHYRALKTKKEAKKFWSLKP
jgi:integrase